MAGSDPWDFSDYDQPPSGPPGSPATGSVASTPGEPDASLGYAEAPRPDGGALTVGRAPVQWLAFSAVASVIGLVVAGLLGGLPAAAVAAWVISGPVAVSLIGAFTHLDTRQRAHAVYGVRAWVRPAYVGTLVLCGLAVVLSSVRIAFWLGRL